MSLPKRRWRSMPLVVLFALTHLVDQPRSLALESPPPPMIEVGDFAIQAINDKKSGEVVVSGLIFDVTDPTGQTLIINVGFRIGTTLVEKIVFHDGTEKIFLIREFDYVSASIEAALLDPTIKQIELGVFRSRIIEDNSGIAPDILESTYVFARFERGQPVELELRLYDHSLQWDIVGSTIKGRALSAGFGLGLVMFTGVDDGTGHSWNRGALLYGKVAGVYSFTKNFNINGAIEVFPLIQGGPNVYDGTIVIGALKLEYQLTEHIVAYLENRYQMAAIPAKSTGAIEKVYHDNKVSGGAIIRW